MLRSRARGKQESSVSEDQVPVIRTYVEMETREGLRPGREVPGFEFVRLIDGAEQVKRLHDEVGGPYDWSPLAWPVEKWREQLANPQFGIFALRTDGTDAGFLFLATRPGDVVEICLFGLRPQYVGRGMGGHALTLACEAAWDFQPAGNAPAVKVILDTCTKDHPRALANYLARGFVVTRTGIDKKH
jgi:RimJ/RimL family protein N-acetyltransferase